MSKIDLLKEVEDLSIVDTIIVKSIASNILNNTDGDFGGFEERKKMKLILKEILEVSLEVSNCSLGSIITNPHMDFLSIVMLDLLKNFTIEKSTEPTVEMDLSFSGLSDSIDGDLEKVPNILREVVSKSKNASDEVEKYEKLLEQSKRDLGYYNSGIKLLLNEFLKETDVILDDNVIELEPIGGDCNVKIRELKKL